MSTKRKADREHEKAMERERAKAVRKPPGVHRAEQAFEAGCAHWVALDTAVPGPAFRPDPLRRVRIDLGDK